MDWQPVQRPAELAESRLLKAILSGHFPVNTTLPGERELAEQIGVTRPTLREALQRLARDGWLDIQHGKPTRVCDYWREGNLAVLSVLARSPAHQSPDFVVHLLDLRILIAPAYTRQAVLAAPQELATLLEGYASLEDNPQAFAHADWELHQHLTQWSANPVFRLLLNGFQQIYVMMGEHYFAYPACRQASRRFYNALLECARSHAECDAETLARFTMEESLRLWQEMQEMKK
jgi:GntR family transcriptional regulator, negative regulator for fad regulon and positive regulator of fabA